MAWGVAAKRTWARGLFVLLGLLVAALVFWVVAPSLAANDAGEVTGTTSSGDELIDVEVRDEDTGTPLIYLSCASGSLDFRLSVERSSHDDTELRLGEVTGSTWDDCIGPAGFAPSVDHQDNWTIESRSGLVDGRGEVRISNIDANVHGMDCEFDLSGYADAELRLDDKEVDVSADNSRVAISNVEGCFGQVSNGDRVGIDATFDLK